MFHIQSFSGDFQLQYAEITAPQQSWGPAIPANPNRAALYIASPVSVKLIPTTLQSHAVSGYMFTLSPPQTLVIYWERDGFLTTLAWSANSPGINEPLFFAELLWSPP